MSVYTYQVERRDGDGGWHRIGDTGVAGDVTERRPDRAAKSLADRLHLHPHTLTSPIRVSVWPGYVAAPDTQAAGAYTIHPG